MNGAYGRPRMESVPCAVSRGHATPNVTTMEKEGEGAADAQPTLRGGDIEARQHKSEEGDATPDLLLKHLDTTLPTYV